MDDLLERAMGVISNGLEPRAEGWEQAAREWLTAYREHLRGESGDELA